MSRINDVGGMQGFPAVIEEPDEPPFHSDWEAHVFALNGALLKRGVYNLDEFRDAQERLPVREYLAASYYDDPNINGLIDAGETVRASRTDPNIDFSWGAPGDGPPMEEAESAWLHREMEAIIASFHIEKAPVPTGKR